MNIKCTYYIICEYIIHIGDRISLLIHVKLDCFMTILKHILFEMKKT